VTVVGRAFFGGFHKIKKMREVHAEYIRETPSFVHVSMDITPADANKSSYSYGPWILRKAEELAPVSTSTRDKIAWKLPNRILSFGGHSVKNNSNNSNNSNNHTKKYFRQCWYVVRCTISRVRYLSRRRRFRHLRTLDRT